MEVDPDQLKQDEKAEKLEAFLKTRKEHKDEKAEILLENSREKAKYYRMHSADADALSRNKKAEKLDKFLKGLKKRRKEKNITVSTVKAEAAKILEEFLRSQLESLEVGSKSPQGRYERYVEVDIIEETTPSSEGSGFNRQDSIPFADEEESDVALKKADSLPADHKEKYLGDSNDKLKVPVIHEKSQSAPHASSDTENIPQYVPKRAKTAPPPAPPGTPYSISEEGSPEKVPYIGTPQLTDQSSSLPCSTDGHSIETLDDLKYSSFKSSDHDIGTPESSRVRHLTPERQPPDSLDIIPHLLRDKTLIPLSEQEMKKSHSSSPSPKKSRNSLHRKLFKKSGSVSSSDTDTGSSAGLHGRKKKSVFKKAQERLRSLLRIQNDQESPSDAPPAKMGEEKRPIKKPKKKQKHHQKDKGTVDDEMDVYEHEAPSGQVLEERFIHTNKQIGQHHNQWGGGLVRTEDATEVVDINGDGGKKHIEKHWKVKESSDSSKGIMGRLRRMTSRDKDRKKQIKTSKSSTFEQMDKKNYQRTISAPGNHGDGRQLEPAKESNQKVQVKEGGFSVTDIDRDQTGNTEHIKATQVVSRPIDVRRNSSHLDIVDHAGAMVERIWFDPDDDLPRNESFDFNLESCVHEMKIKNKGKVHTVRDIDMHQHFDTAEDLETDGNMEEETEDKVADMTQEEREQLYGVIAERLAVIGDSYENDKKDQAGKVEDACPLRRFSLTSGRNPDEISREHLNPLEMEISDTLREVANDIDERLAENARQAAIRIAGAVTYGQFKRSVGDAVGKEIGWNQVSALFNITRRAMQVAGASGALAVQIKEMSLRYFEDTFANWIVGQGGWDSMLSDISTDSELD